MYVITCKQMLRGRPLMIWGAEEIEKKNSATLLRENQVAANDRKNRDRHGNLSSLGKSRKECCFEMNIKAFKMRKIAPTVQFLSLAAT